MLAFALVLVALWSCDDYETYGERKEKERDAISEYIKSRNIKEITEDESKKGQESVQKLVDKYIKTVDTLREAKEKEIMEV